MPKELDTWGISLTTGFTAWFKPQEDITAYELSLLMILCVPARRTLVSAQEAFDVILETAPLIIRHFDIRESNAR